jgi:hypothetical protein
VKPRAAAKPDPKAARRQQQLAKVEQRLEKLAAELAGLEGQMAAAAVSAEERQELARLAARHSAVREAHEALEAEWLTLYGQAATG